MEIYCLILPKVFVRKSFSVSQASGIEKVYDKRGYVTIFCRFFLSRSTEKVFVEEPFSAVFQETSASENCMDKSGGDYQSFSVGNLLRRSAETSRIGIF